VSESENQTIKRHANGMSPEEIRRAIDAIRRRDGLPVTSIDRLLEQRGVPSRLWVVAQNPRTTACVGLVSELLDGKGCILAISGHTGCGKSSAAASALAARTGMWVHAPDLARPPLDGDNVDDRMRYCGLLVLDDVGTEHSPSGYAAKRICSVLEHREGNRRPTILTTNLTAEQFKAAYGERIASRLNGDPLGWQHVSGPDFRRNPAHWSDGKQDETEDSVATGGPIADRGNA
jgi:hypothetical protein